MFDEGTDTWRCAKRHYHSQVDVCDKSLLCCCGFHVAWADNVTFSSWLVGHIFLYQCHAIQYFPQSDCTNTQARANVHPLAFGGSEDYIDCPWFHNIALIVEAFFSTNQHVGGRMILRCLMFFREHVSFSSAFPQKIKKNMLTCHFSMANLRFFGFDQLASFPIMMWRRWWRLLPKRNGWRGSKRYWYNLINVYIYIYMYIFIIF